VDEVLRVLGGFLIVLIAIELFLNIVLYLRKDVGHLKLVIATALVAVARKVIIMDYEHIDAGHLYPTAALIFALAFAYWLIKRPRWEKI
jgi:uncharacterized membrane protein (DUF373 family)